MRKYKECLVILDLNEVNTLDAVDYTQQIVNLLMFGQELCEQTQGVVPQLCQKIAQITKEQAHLHVYTAQQPEVTQWIGSALSISLPVQFRNRRYGTLQLAADSIHMPSPILPMQVAYLLSQVCGWILYAVEQSAILQSRYSQLIRPIRVCLTKREKEVLILIGHGYSNDRIAEILTIAPTTVIKHRQRIYEQMGVHSERDALLVAYQAGLFSPLDESWSTS